MMWKNITLRVSWAKIPLQTVYVKLEFGNPGLLINGTVLVGGQAARPRGPAEHAYDPDSEKLGL